MLKTKVLMVGPCQSGKSTIANFLSDATETSGGDYHPTQGVRILEFEIKNTYVGSRNMTAEVELWDVSGDRKFESCWPAVAKDTGGVVFVFNPESSNYDKELEEWHAYMEKAIRVKDVQCIIFAHSQPGQRASGGMDLPSSMKNIQCVNTTLDDDGTALREEFNNYISNLLTAMHEKSDQEELNILKS